MKGNYLRNSKTIYEHYVLLVSGILLVLIACSTTRITEHSNQDIQCSSVSANGEMINWEQVNLSYNETVREVNGLIFASVQPGDGANTSIVLDGDYEIGSSILIIGNNFFPLLQTTANNHDMFYPPMWEGLCPCTTFEGSEELSISDVLFSIVGSVEQYNIISLTPFVVESDLAKALIHDAELQLEENFGSGFGLGVEGYSFESDSLCGFIYGLAFAESCNGKVYLLNTGNDLHIMNVGVSPNIPVIMDINDNNYVFYRYSRPCTCDCGYRIYPL